MHACYIIPEWLQRAKETRHFREILEAKARNPWKCKGDLLDVRQESKEPSCRRGWEAVGCWPWSLAAGSQWSCSREARRARPGLDRWPAEQMSRQQVQMGEQIDRRMTIPVGGISSGDPVKLRALGSEELTAYPSLDHIEGGQMMGHHHRVRSPSLFGVQKRGLYHSLVWCVL